MPQSQPQNRSPEVAASPRAADIQVTGYLSDQQITEWYGRASIFAFPSLDEGFGMPVLEAMAAGIPVIAGKRSALPEVCGDAAVLVDPEDQDELAGGLVRLALDQGLRDEMIARGLSRANQFSWGKAVQETLNIYRELG